MQSDQKLVLSRHGQQLYDNIVLFAPEMTKHSDAIIEFVENGGNVLIAVDGEASAPMRLLVASFGVELDKEGHSLIDHL